MPMKARIFNLSVILFLFFAATGGYCQQKESSAKSTKNTNKVSVWITNSDKSALFEKQKDKISFTSEKNPHPNITINDRQTFQTIDGFGYCLTGGSAMLIHHMEAASRAALLKELFATDKNN